MPPHIIDSIADTAQNIHTFNEIADSTFHVLMYRLDSLNRAINLISEELRNPGFDWNTFWVAIFTAVLPLIGALVGVYFLNKKANKELQLRFDELTKEFDYREKEQELSVAKIILPRCLEVLQSAFVKTMAVNTLLTNASIAVADEKADKEESKRLREALVNELKSLRKWYDENCLYLPEEIRNNFVGLINISFEHIRELFNYGTIREGKRDAWDKYMDVSHSVQESINVFMTRYNLIDRIIKGL